MKLITPVLIIRIAAAGNLFIHGMYRLLSGSVYFFEEYLQGVGFPPYVAFAITFFEIIASVLILANRWVRILSICFIAELVAGIIMVHAREGWFVVGGGRNGMEYSVLLILCFAALIVSTLSKEAGRS